MKRMLGIFMVLLLVTAPAIAQGAAVEGDWELICVVVDGITYEDLDQQGLSMTMRLEEDGTGVQTIDDEVYPVTWVEAEGEILIDDGGGPIPYILQPDGALLGEVSTGNSMTFVPAAAADSVAGAWQMTVAQSEGIIITDTSTLGIELSLLLNEDGTGTLFSSEGDSACTWTQSGAAVTIMMEDSQPQSFALQGDGTLEWVVNGVTLILTRTDGVPAAQAPEVSENEAVVSEYGFRVELPQDWVAIDSEYIAQIIESVGEAIASANGLDQSLLDQLAASNTSLYYAPDMTANFNVVREPAGNVTMDNFTALEPSYQQLFTAQGITDFKLSGPVEIGGNAYYMGTFTALAGLEQTQYFCVANGYIYTITLTNVSDSDAQQIMESFEIL